jgi:RNA polymerase sigma-70 factor (ECF subfamily)
MAADLDLQSDDILLTTDDPEAFGTFYDRHVHSVLGYFARRTGDPETAADLTAETFASALTARRRYRPNRAPASAWLFAIAARRLADWQRRGHVEQRAQRALRMERVALDADDTELIGMLGAAAAADLLADLPPDQREAIRAHVIEERDYAEIAGAGRVSEPVVRQRVSRGLATLRRRMGGSR